MSDNKKQGSRAGNDSQNAICSPHLLEEIQRSLVDCSWIKIPELTHIFNFLQESEDHMIALFDYIKDPSHPPADPTGGNVEFGMVLFWLDNPPPELQTFLNEHPMLEEIFQCMQQIAPTSRITPCEYQTILLAVKEGGPAADDGTMLGDSTYEQLDHKWSAAAINYVLNVVFKFLVKDFPNKPVANVQLSRKDGDTKKDPVLGILGDWGTGSYSEKNGEVCPAIRVRDQMVANPAAPIDYLVHLGDVYYAGTDAYREPVGEEQDNFYSLWPDQGDCRNFTLNSNHEMYGGANGYFDVALQKPGMFDTQNGMSYFAMTYGPWLVLGLDSAYYSDIGNATKSAPLHFYMEGAIGSPAFKQQFDWVSQFKNWPGPVMVMTHHTACDLSGAHVNLLYHQVRAALGREPSLWYWGHLHNGIAYKQIDTYPEPGNSKTLARCCGHGAIPFGRAWGLEDSAGNMKPDIDYFARTPDPKVPNGVNAGARTRMKNGYATVALHKDGGFTESFFEVDNLEPVWSKKWPASEVHAQVGDPALSGQIPE